jgi:hypothetical protein
MMRCHIHSNPPLSHAGKWEGRGPQLFDKMKIMIVKRKEGMYGRMNRKRLGREEP